MTPLIVIDMQPFFSETADKCLAATLDQIRLAKQRKAPIMIVEYRGCGPSYKQLLDAVDGYDKVTFVKKSSDGGGEPVMNAARANGFQLKKVRVVGVNRSWCVFSTVSEMLCIMADMIIEIPEKATWCSQPRTGLSWLESLGCRIK